VCRGVCVHTLGPVFGSCRCVVVFVSTHWRPMFGSCRCVVVFVSTHWRPVFESCRCVVVFLSTHWQPVFGSCRCVTFVSICNYHLFIFSCDLEIEIMYIDVYHV